MRTIFWVGDSTVQYNDWTTYPQTGLGQVLPLYLNTDITVKNLAKNGRSTKSFLDEGRFRIVEEEIKAGDFLFIQFGHNDEKIQDKLRYTSPDGTFRENLMNMADAALRAGAYPVFITPLARRDFDEKGNLRESKHTDYQKAMIALGREKRIPCIDLTEMSRNELKANGMEKTKDWYMNIKSDVSKVYPEGKTDNTHLQYDGAFRYAGLIAKGLSDLGGRYEKLLKQDELKLDELFKDLAD